MQLVVPFIIVVGRDQSGSLKFKVVTVQVGSSFYIMVVEREQSGSFKGYAKWSQYKKHTTVVAILKADTLVQNLVWDIKLSGSSMFTFSPFQQQRKPKIYRTW